MDRLLHPLLEQMRLGLLIPKYMSYILVCCRQTSALLPSDFCSVTVSNDFPALFTICRMNHREFLPPMSQFSNPRANIKSFTFHVILTSQIISCHHTLSISLSHLYPPLLYHITAILITFRSSPVNFSKLLLKTNPFFVIHDY